MLDVRRLEDFLRLHHPNAANIPLEELDARSHELCSAHVVLDLYDADETRAEAAAAKLRAAGRQVGSVFHGREWLTAGPGAAGPSMHRLWRPHALLVEAVELAGDAWGDFTGRAALDIACGTGRDAVFLASQGLRVDAWDVLPDALERCLDLARRNGVELICKAIDVENQPEISAAAYDLVCCFNFLHRPLLPIMAASVTPGGFLVYETFVDPQRALFGKPSRPAHVLRPGELAAAFADMELIVSREGLVSPRRHAASLIARKCLSS